MRQGRYTVTFDQDFEGVIKACAGKREGHYGITWITPRIMRAYAALFDAGYVHSFEVWNAEGKLVGGGYGVALGRVFSTESQFSHEPNTSKIGFSVLNWHLARWGYVLDDGKGKRFSTWAFVQSPGPSSYACSPNTGRVAAGREFGRSKRDPMWSPAGVRRTGPRARGLTRSPPGETGENGWMISAGLCTAQR